MSPVILMVAGFFLSWEQGNGFPIPGETGIHEHDNMLPNNRRFGILKALWRMGKSCFIFLAKDCPFSNCSNFNDQFLL
jgi:hypothetical protein